MQAKGICFDGSRLDSQLSQFVSDLNSPVIITDTNGIIQYSNEQFNSLSQFEPGDSIGKRPSLWSSGNQDEQFYRAMWSTISNGKSWNGHIENLRKDRSSYHASMTILPVINNLQQIVHYIAMHKPQNPETYDVTNKILVGNSDDLVGQNLPHLCHDMRNYLTSIIGTAGIISKQNLDNKTDMMIKRINSSASFLNLMMNDILDISKANHVGSDLLSDVDLSVPEILSEVSDIFYDAVLNRSNKISIGCDSALASQVYIGDRYKIQRILSNLIGNSVKFTQNGQIHIEAKLLHNQKESDLILISVKDTGAGIDKANAKNLFKEFSQEDQKTSSRFGGTGLGLSLCKLFVTSMGGDIGFESEKGYGSEFWFTLPLTKKINTHTEGRSKSFDSSLKVMVCDDDETQQILLKRTLTVMGLECTIASDGKEARNLLQKGDFDYLFLDCNMPVEDGYKCASKIRRENSEESRNLKIIGLTGFSNETVVKKCMQAGMNTCLTKIADPVLMSRCLEQILKTFESESKSDQSDENNADIYRFRKEKLPVVCN